MSGSGIPGLITNAKIKDNKDKNMNNYLEKLENAAKAKTVIKIKQRRNQMPEMIFQ